MGDSWQDYVEYNVRDHQDHKAPGEIHTKSERVRNTFDSHVQPIDHGFEHIVIQPRRQTIFLTGSVEAAVAVRRATGTVHAREGCQTCARKTVYRAGAKACVLCEIDSRFA